MTYTERATRKKLIDQALSSAGWTYIQPYENRVRFRSGSHKYLTIKGSSDYVLISNRQPLTVVEAKNLRVGSQHELQQAL